MKSLHRIQSLVRRTSKLVLGVCFGFISAFVIAAAGLAFLQVPPASAEAPLNTTVEAATGMTASSNPQPLPARAAPSPALANCFFRNECLGKNTPKGESCDLGCDKPGVVCHCFEPRPECIGGGGFCYQKWPAVKLSVPIGGKDYALDLADYIAKLYNYGAGIAAILAGVMIIIGGFEWITAISGGQIDRAKKRIYGAAIGLLLALGAITLLNTVNPDTVALRLPKVPIIKKAAYNPECTSTEQCVVCGLKYVVARPKDAPKDWKPPPGCDNVIFRPQDGDPPPGCTGCKKWDDSLAEKFDLTNECTGKGCAAAGCGGDADTRCRPPKDGEKTDSACPKPAAGAAVSYMCAACKKTGDACATPGKDDGCCGGFCGKKTCTNGEIGDKCDSNDSCKTGLCQTKRLNSCSAGLTGSPCDDNTECRGGNVCVAITGLKVCLPPKAYGFCSSDAQCPGGTKCKTTLRGLAEGLATSGLITSEAYCIPDGGTQTCLRNSGCPTRYCLSSSQICSDRMNGSPCNGPGDCESGKCIDSAATLPPGAPNGVCSGGNYGERCDKNSECISNHCYKAGDFGACVTGDLDSGCDAKSGCIDGLHCDASSKRCVK